MIRIVTREDLRDIYIKASQRSVSFLASKLNIKSKARTKSSFNNVHLETANWWIIPQVKERWNMMISGNPVVTYEEYFIRKYFPKQQKLKLLSIGSGVCSHEMRIAELKPEWEIHCVDFSEQLLHEAKRIAEEKGIHNIFFHAKDIASFKQRETEFDLIFFHQSLHHFERILLFMEKTVIPLLKSDGFLIINEFVGSNRLQFSQTQIAAINEAIKLIPNKFRKIYKTNLYKNKYYGSGLLRMLVSDPSECVDSERILPEIHKKFSVIEEKPFGGNLLMSALKDIAHHFVIPDTENQTVLHNLFSFEDVYLSRNDSDFVFGIYRLRC